MGSGFQRIEVCGDGCWSSQLATQEALRFICDEAVREHYICYNAIVTMERSTSLYYMFAPHQESKLSTPCYIWTKLRIPHMTLQFLHESVNTLNGSNVNNQRLA
eukprot:3962459-Amphidinium_carterae.1